MTEQQLLTEIRAIDASASQKAEAERIAGQRMAGRRMAGQDWEDPGLAGFLQALKEVVARDSSDWVCPSCGRVWHTPLAQDGYGCEDMNCPH